MIFINRTYLDDEVIERINDDLEQKYYGWFLNYNAKGSYFLSVFNEFNQAEELIFDFDFNKPGYVKEGLRFSDKNDEVRVINKGNKYYKKVSEVIEYIKDTYL